MDLNLGVIGNCTYGAMVDRTGRLVWCCLPRFDGDPVFCQLLDGGGDADQGVFAVELEGLSRSEQPGAWVRAENPVRAPKRRKMPAISSASAREAQKLPCCCARGSPAR